MNFKRLLHTDFGQTIISILLGLGLATLFRKVCKDRQCMLFKGPKMSKIKGKTFKYNNKCYKYVENAETCNKKKRIVEFA